MTLNVDKGLVDLDAFGQPPAPSDNPQSINSPGKNKRLSGVVARKWKANNCSKCYWRSNRIELVGYLVCSMREEMPGLEQLYEEYKDKGLEVIGVSVDSFGMDDRIKLFAERMSVTLSYLA